MTFLGGQILITLGILSFFHKFGDVFSLSRLLIVNRCHFYHPPTDDDLKERAGLNPPKNKKQKNQNKHLQPSSNFNIPKKLNYPIYAQLVQESHLQPLKFYSEFKWLIDFGFTAFLAYLISEFYYFWTQSEEINLSLIWCCLVIIFATKILHTLTAALFSDNDQLIGERSICICFGGVYFLISMVILIVNDRFLEFGLGAAYQSFNSTATEFLIAHQIGHASVGPASQIMFRFWLAIWSGLIGVYFIFPGLRFSQMHWYALKNYDSSVIVRSFLHFNFITPIFLLLLWVQPIARTPLVERSWFGRPPLLKASHFEIIRIVAVILFFLAKLISVMVYIQFYLDIPLQKVSDMQKHAGKIKKLDVQLIFMRIKSYMCVAILQYVAPAVLIIFTTLLLKTLGEYTFWSDHDWSKSMGTPSAEFTWKNLRLIFNPIVFRGILNYMTWWIIFASFLSNLIGYVYQSYFSVPA